MEIIWKEVVVASLEQMGKITENKLVLLVLNWASPKYKCRELPQHQPAQLCYQCYKKP
jgi:hypothetical protein